MSPHGVKHQKANPDTQKPTDLWNAIGCLIVALSWKQGTQWTARDAHEDFVHVSLCQLYNWVLVRRPQRKYPGKGRLVTVVKSWGVSVVFRSQCADTVSSSGTTPWKVISHILWDSQGF